MYMESPQCASSLCAYCIPGEGPGLPRTHIGTSRFESREAEISFSLESLQSEGFDVEEINLMPVAGSPGSRFQLRELND